MDRVQKATAYSPTFNLFFLKGNRPQRRKPATPEVRRPREKVRLRRPRSRDGSQARSRRQARAPRLQALRARWPPFGRLCKASWRAYPGRQPGGLPRKLPPPRRPRHKVRPGARSPLSQPVPHRSQYPRWPAKSNALRGQMDERPRRPQPSAPIRKRAPGQPICRHALTRRLARSRVRSVGSGSGNRRRTRRPPVRPTERAGAPVGKNLPTPCRPKAPRSSRRRLALIKTPYYHQIN
jgi:hypothetical protein